MVFVLQVKVLTLFKGRAALQRQDSSFLCVCCVLFWFFPFHNNGKSAAKRPDLNLLRKNFNTGEVQSPTKLQRVWSLRRKMKALGNGIWKFLYSFLMSLCSCLIWEIIRIGETIDKSIFLFRNLVCQSRNNEYFADSS